MHTEVVETKQGPVEYVEEGDGIPVLYFHGTGVLGHTMISVESPLTEEGVRLIVPNRPGYGQTPLHPHETAAGCSNVAAALLDQIGIEQVGVMGSSGGAAFAASFAINHPNRTNCLILLCPQLHCWDHKQWLPASSRWTLPWLKSRLLRKLLLKLYRMQLPRMSVKQFLKMEAGDRYPEVADDPAVQRLCIQSLEAMVEGTRCAGFENDFVVFTNENIFAAQKSLETPTLVIHDEADPMAPVCHIEWFRTHVPGIEQLSLKTAGHLIWAGLESEVMHTTRMRFLDEHAVEKRKQ